MKKFLKAEMWDKMQFLFRNYYDRTIHTVMTYDGDIDIDIFKEAVKKIVDQVPVYHSKFCNNPIRPYWRICKYDINDIVIVENSADPDAAANQFILQTMPYNKNVQVKFGVFIGEGKCAIGYIVNHMCHDGGDAKYILAKLVEFYNALKDGTECEFKVKSGDRGYKQVYTKFNEEDRKIAEGLYKNVSIVKDKHTFPLTKKDKKNDTLQIHKHKLTAEMFDRLKVAGAKYGATVNDIFLMAYFRALFKVGNYGENDMVAIPCMVDLRRHIIDNGSNTGITNHTGFMICKMEGVGETVFDTLDKVKASIAESKNEKFLGLYSLPLLSLAYTIFPQFISEIAIGIGYVNPLIGMSNIGLLKEEIYTLSGLKLTDMFMTGAVKYKPFMQLATTTYNKVVTFTIAIRGNDKDAEMVKEFYKELENNFETFIKEALK